ncbi:helix-turn-helix domain-containing protein, partial [Actinomyces qiguomingii]
YKCRSRRVTSPSRTHPANRHTLKPEEPVIGGKWKIEILFYVALAEVRHFGKLKRCLHGVSDSTLSKQLRELVADDFLERIDYGEVPPRVEYRLTRRGKSFKPLIQAMWDWSEAEFEFSRAEAAQMRSARDELGIPQVR